MHELPDKKNDLRALTRGVLATVAWMMVAGLCVQHRHDVPSITEYKSSVANVTSCAAADVQLLNQCLDDKYERLLSGWRSELATAVVLPPMLAWIAALLGSLGRDLGLLRRPRQPKERRNAV